VCRARPNLIKQVGKPRQAFALIRLELTTKHIYTIQKYVKTTTTTTTTTT
jgi:hypothetical protein